MKTTYRSSQLGHQATPANKTPTMLPKQPQINDEPSRATKTQENLEHLYFNALKQGASSDKIHFPEIDLINGE